MAQTTKTGLPTLGEVVLAWRKAKQFSSTQLAKKAGVRIAYLSEIEHNKTQYPREEYLEKLAIALGLEVQDIYARRMPQNNQGAGQAKEGGNKKEVVPSTVYQTPLALKHQKVLLHQLEVLEKKVEVEKKNINDIHEAIRELKAIVIDMLYEG